MSQKGFCLQAKYKFWHGKFIFAIRMEINE